MAIIRCDKGHYYDNTKFSQCPHCGVLPVMEKEKENGRNNHQPVVKTKAKSKSKLFSLFHRGAFGSAGEFNAGRRQYDCHGRGCSL